MKATYQHCWLWFLVAIFMVPIAYGQGETILGAYFMNGNTDVFSSRIYLWNPSDSPGDVTVRVFTLPLTSGTTQELTSTPRGLGTLGAKSAFNIKLAEDILTPIGVSVPYTADGGNLTLEFTIGAAGVQGVAQVFSGDFAFGTYPLQVISVSAGNNTSTGFQALLNNTTGSNNTGTGFQALLNNTTGNDNTAMGTFALLNNMSGSNNIAIGRSAGTLGTTGNDNITIGTSAGKLATGGNNIYIGNLGVAAESNTIRFGSASGHSSAFIAGVRVVPPSSKRFKEDIRDMGEASTGLMRLRPVTFRYKKEYEAGDSRLQYGLIAEEVAEVYPELVQYVEGKAKTVLYQQLPAIMLNELQKQHRQIQELTERLAQLEQVLTAQQSVAGLNPILTKGR